MTTLFEGMFESIGDVFDQWYGAREELSKPGTELLYAAYDRQDYEGDAFAIFMRDGLIYEVHCSHCSCNGLDEFKPERTCWEALIKQERVQSSAALSSFETVDDFKVWQVQTS